MCVVIDPNPGITTLQMACFEVAMATFLFVYFPFNNCVAKVEKQYEGLCWAFKLLWTLLSTWPFYTQPAEAMSCGRVG